VRRGRLGIGATCAGNHTQVYGFEELCRSAYTRRWLRETCSVTNDTMLMTDMNGLTSGSGAADAEAEIRNLLWSPNQWNPLPSTLVPYDKSFVDYHWNPDAGGGGSRMDVRWKSSIPMLFWWQAAADKGTCHLVGQRPARCGIAVCTGDGHGVGPCRRESDETARESRGEGRGECGLYCAVVRRL